MTASAALRASFRGAVITPEDDGYDAARIVWNGVVDRRPALIARCNDASDVVAALRFARENDLVVAVRSGGHSVAGFGTCDEGIVIDLSAMRGVTVDPAAKRARVNGGAHLKELDEAAQAHGLVCPVGVVGHTGVAGLTLGGGMGRLMRRFGLTIDSLAAVDLVAADGKQLRVSETEEPELFWGLRGAGANFGIVTAFEFRLHPYDGRMTHGFLVYPGERAREIAETFRAFSETCSEDVQASFGVGVGAEDDPPELRGKFVSYLTLAHSGTTEAAERELAPLLGLGGTILNTVADKTYLEMQAANDETMAWGKRFYMKSGFLPGMTDDVVDAMLALEPNPDGGLFLWAWGGAVGRVAEDATAFAGRDAAYWASSEVFWTDPARDEANIEWGRAAIGALEPFATERRYVNDVVEVGQARSVYGDAKYERLVALKRAWDPDNVFRLNQNIKP